MINKYRNYRLAKRLNTIPKFDKKFKYLYDVEVFLKYLKLPYKAVNNPSIGYGYRGNMDIKWINDFTITLPNWVNDENIKTIDGFVDHTFKMHKKDLNELMK